MRGAERVQGTFLTDRMAYVAWIVLEERIVHVTTAPDTNELVRGELRQLAAGLRAGHDAFEVERTKGALVEGEVRSGREISTRQAASMLGLKSTQAITQMLADGRLDGSQVSPGQPWLVAEQSVLDEIARRENGAA